jgi:hypothetical protein
MILVRSMVIRTAGWVTLDGYPAGGRLIGPSYASACFSNIATSSITARPCIFSRLDFTGDFSIALFLLPSG